MQQKMQFILISMLVGMLGMSGMAWGQAAKVKIVPGKTTHMGQKVSEHVMLEVFTSADGPVFTRNFPDGTRPGLVEFRVPEGQVLIVTDVDWQLNDGPSLGRGILRIFIENLDNPFRSVRVFESTILLNANGDGGISEAMTTGFVVSSAGRLKPDLLSGGLLNHAILRGYLAPDK